MSHFVTITLATEDEAAEMVTWVNETIHDGDRQATHEGRTVELDPDGLDLLKARAEDQDWHYDGSCVWSGGLPIDVIQGRAAFRYDYDASLRRQ